MHITRAVVIALNIVDVIHLQHQISIHVAPRVNVVQAINGTSAMEMTRDTLPLYTRHLIRYGRQNHVQIGNWAMLGCLLSHISVWRGIAPGETVAVFEEDAHIDSVSAIRLESLGRDMDTLEAGWDMIMLDKGQLIDTGRTVPVGDGMAARCADGEACMRYGTRGYLIRYEGAQTLLHFSKPHVVQVDALVGLVATYSPATFRLFWSTEDIAHPSNWRLSTVWDGCVWECFFREWLVILMLFPLFVFTLCKIKSLCRGVLKT